jgi:hypothetical protein
MWRSIERERVEKSVEKQRAEVNMERVETVMDRMNREWQKAGQYVTQHSINAVCSQASPPPTALSFRSPSLPFVLCECCCISLLSHAVLLSSFFSV